MRMLNFAKRNTKELARDPLSLIFAVLLPLFLLFIFQQFEIPSEAYRIENFTPGIVIFGFAFVTMFTAVLVAKDRSTSLLVRLAISPMTGMDYVGGYTLSLLPLVLLQVVLFFAVALLLGLAPTSGILWVIFAALPISLLFIFLGILLGSFTTDKSSAGLSSIVVQLVAFTGGLWFDGEMAGDFFAVLCRILPFEAATRLLKKLLSGSFTDLLSPLLIFAGYAIAVALAAVLVFRRNMLKGNS